MILEFSVINKDGLSYSEINIINDITADTLIIKPEDDDIDIDVEE